LGQLTKQRLASTDIRVPRNSYITHSFIVNMASNKTLHIFDSSKEKDKYGGYSFNINKQLGNVNDTKREKIFSYFTKRANDVNEDVPFFESIWPYLALPGNGRGKLIPQILFLDCLEEYAQDYEFERIQTHNLSNQYRAAVEDFCADNGLQYVHQRPKRDAKKRFIRAKIILFFLDQIFSLIISKIIFRKSGSEIAIFPYPGRFESTKPVIKNLSIDVSVIPSHLTISWLFYSSDEFKNVTHVRPINTYTSIKTILKQILCLIRLIYNSKKGEYRIEHSLTADLEKNFEHYMPNSVHYATDTAIRSRLRQILTYYIFRDVYVTEDCSAALVGGDTPRDRFALAAAEENNLQMYYIPHSIICGYEILPAQQDTVQFVEGQYAVDYLEASELRKSLPVLEPTGRPYFEKFNSMQVSVSEITGTPSILVATQPFNDGIREEFIINILNSIKNSPQDFIVKIKIHPSEQMSFYEQILSEQKIEGVPIYSGDIYKHLQQTDLTITINSNVGLESVLAGSGTISYNIWNPRTTIFPYIDISPIPSATTTSQLDTILSDLTPDSIEEMSQNQLDFFKEKLVLSGASTKTIEYIENNYK